MCTSAGVGVVTVLSATSTCTGSDGGETSSFCTYEENICFHTYVSKHIATYMELLWVYMPYIIGSDARVPVA